MNRLMYFLPLVLALAGVTTPAAAKTHPFYDEAEKLAARYAGNLEPANAFHVIVVMDDGDDSEPFVGTLARFPLTTADKGSVDDKRRDGKSDVSLSTGYDIRGDAMQIEAFRLKVHVELDSGKQVGGATLGTLIHVTHHFSSLKLQRAAPQGIGGGMTGYGRRDPDRFVSYCVYVVWK